MFEVAVIVLAILAMLWTLVFLWAVVSPTYLD
jgi:hypothetical protein